MWKNGGCNLCFNAHVSQVLQKGSASAMIPAPALGHCSSRQPWEHNMMHYCMLGYAWWRLGGHKEKTELKLLLTIVLYTPHCLAVRLQYCTLHTVLHSESTGTVQYCTVVAFVEGVIVVHCRPTHHCALQLRNCCQRPSLHSLESPAVAL